MATDWSITHSPTPRYLLTHFEISLLSPATLSVLKLGLESATVSSAACSVLRRARRLRCRLGDGGPTIGGWLVTHVRPVERFMPARKAETEFGRLSAPTRVGPWRRKEGRVPRGTYRAQRQRHNGSTVRALTTVPKSASRGTGSDLRLRSDDRAESSPRPTNVGDASEEEEGDHPPPS